MPAIKVRHGARAVLILVCAVVGLGIAVVCVIIALGLVKPEHPGTDSLTSERLLRLENGVLESRQQIKSGHMILTVKDIDRSHGNSLKEYEIYFDGDKSRADLRVAGRLESQNIATKDEIIRVIGENKPQVIVLNQPAKSVMEIPDPRRLGLINWYFESINQFDFARHLARPDRVDVQVEPAIRNGDSVWVVTFKSKTGNSTTEYWLARDKGNLPTFISVTSGKDPRSVQSIEVELSKWADGDVWFPKKVRFRSVHGEQIDSEETVIVEKAQFGRAIDDTTFRLLSVR